MNAAIEALARQALRGAFPRSFSGEQSYWTLIGVDGGAASGLVGEDGAIELGKGGPSIEPFVIDGGHLVTWADGQIGQSLEDGYLPIPSVTWRRRGWTLRITCFAEGEPRHPRLAARYELRNLTGRRRTMVMALGVRPFQVNGPEQFLNTPGGVSPIHDLAWNGATLTIDGRRRVRPLTPQVRFLDSPVNFAGLPALLASPRSQDQVHDGGGLASGVMAWRLTLPAKGTAAVYWVAPLTDTGPPPAPSRFSFARDLADVARGWRQRLGRVAIDVPPASRAVADTLKTSLAIMLISRDGPVLRPGTRSYDRSWIRDGTMISEALLRLGEAGAAADYLRWYVPYQFAGGKAPCCIDARGPDPTQENDSEGEFIHLAAEVYRYGGDRDLLRSLWPRILAAANYMDSLRQSKTGGASAATRGLLPPSISHEGYSAKPAYSYWDDFWALRGYEDAVFIAEVLGERAEAAHLADSTGQFRHDLYASIPASARAHGIDYIPGAADLGDFDATSTTIALSPGGQLAALPRPLLDHTFERYWREFIDRRDRDRTWEAYTPYELRTIGSFVRVGWRDRAGELLDFFMHDRRPLAWNGWAEVVGREARKPRFLGDEPHAWVASDFVRSVLDMFAYGRESDEALVLGAGVPRAWFADAGVGVRDLRTPYGVLTWRARKRGAGFSLRLAGGVRPPGGFIFAWPFIDPPGPTFFNGRSVAWDGGAVRLSGDGLLIVKPARQGPARRG
ncbi:MAG TPA: hypothetical protein VG166_14005 [Caulobacteraceae bacterium]|nr:hypothetical protein [Caulobacteraceae bacterium]